jgi:beta-galactosidase
VLASQDDRWALEIDPHRPGLTHEGLVGAAHAAARRLGHEVDVVAPESDLARYRVVLAPGLILATPERQAALRTALAAGTLVVLGARSLVADADDCWLEEPLPAGFADALGSSVQDFFGLEDPAELALETVALAGDAGRARETIPAGMWAEVLAEPAVGSGAEVVARYATGWQAGRPAAVRHGGLAYLGATSVEAWQALLALLVGPGPAGLGTATRERFVRAGRPITLDHASLTIDGLG